MRNLLFFLSALFMAMLFAAACTRDAVASDNSIRFDQLAVGQQSRYIALKGRNYRTGDGLEFEHSDDTLVLEIVAQDAQGFKVAEKLHYAGVISSWLAYDIDSTYFYYLSVTDDTLRFAPIGTDYVRSRVFAQYYAKPGLPLADFTDTKVEIRGWTADIPFCECIKTGFTKKYKLFGQQYPRLNVFMDNTGMWGDGPGQTYVYSAQYGLVKSAQYNAWTTDGYGWDLLPE